MVQNTIFEPLTTESPDELTDDVPPGMKSLVGSEPTPEFAAEVAETCDALLASLADDNSRQIALLRLENHTADEIAEKLGCSRRTVQRKLLLIRRTWQQTAGIENSENDVSQLEDERALED